jgi:M6 family metalloprotease-like protein
MCAYLSTLTASAVQAKPGFFTVTQPDGSTIRIHKIGDEHIHFTLTDDDCIIIPNNNGDYVFACIDENQNLVPTDILASDIENRSEAAVAVAQKISDIDLDKYAAAHLKQLSFNPSNDFNAQNSNKKASSTTALPQNGVGLYSKKFKTTGKVNALIILVEYSDISFTVDDPQTYYNNFFNAEGFNTDGNSGSVRDYFFDNSFEQFEPQFKVYGPVKLSHKREYYGANDSDGNDKYPYLMVKEACSMLDDEIDFSQFDVDNDDIIDNVYIIYAGVGEASSNVTNSIWPHQDDVRDYDIVAYYDGKQLADYGCCNEWDALDDHVDGIGTVVHEFSHVLGLPDIYATINSYGMTKLAPGAWSVIASGNYNNDSHTPVGYSMFERNALNWSYPRLLGDAEVVTLNDLASSNEGALIQTSDDNEFFLLENRQQSGWDAYLPGHGMMVWRICYDADKWSRNVINCYAHQLVDIIEANNTPDNSSATSMAGYPFPGTSNNQSFTSTTTPAMKMYDGTAVDCPITAITETDGVITFKVKGGREVKTPQLKLAEADSSHFTVEWDDDPTATDYVATVTYENPDEIIRKYTADMGDSSDALTLPDDWTTSASGFYKLTSYCGAAIPSLKMDTDGQYLQSPMLPNDISAINFWYRCNAQTNLSSSISVDGYAANEWKNITTINITQDYQSENYVIEKANIPAGTRQVKITYNKVNGNLALDDVTIQTGGDLIAYMPEYHNVSTSKAPSLTVNNLVSGVSKYYVTVTTISDDLTSLPSEALAVEIKTPTALDTPMANASRQAPIYYNLQGILVNPANLTPGVYIKVSGSEARKILIK